MSARRPAPLPELPHDPVAVLPDGRELRAGAEITIPGEGRFRFKHVFLRDGSLTCYGPVTGSSEGHRSIRSFRPEQVGRIHRKVVGR